MRKTLEIKDLRFQFQKGHELFGGLELDLAQGEWLTFVGPSGCGKSTLFRLIAGLLPIQQGSLRFSQDLGERKMAVVFQEPRLLDWLSVEKNIQLPLKIAGGPEAPLAKISSTLEMVGLSPSKVLRLFPHELSGGMKMRVSLARALMMNSHFLLLDEPFSALDEMVREDLMLLLKKIHQVTKITVLLVTHSIVEATYLSNRVVVLGHQGRIQKQILIPDWLSSEPASSLADRLGSTSFNQTRDQVSRALRGTL